MSWYDQAIAAWYRSKELSAEAEGAGITSAGKSIGGAIKQAGQDRQANQIASQLANTSTYDPTTGQYGGYSPRAGLVSPGIDPITGAINSVGQGVPTGGTAPKVMTGGVQGLQ